MKDNFRTWLGKLQNHTEKCRTVSPLPDRKRLSRAQELQLNIIKGSLLALLRNPTSPVQHEERQKKIPETCILFTSNSAGLVAAMEILQETGSRLLFPLFPAELRNFLQLFPDPMYEYHIHIWSHFLESPDNEQSARIAETFPLHDREKYWLHVEGRSCGPQLATGAEHLWSWDGVQPKLLKKGLRFWAS